MPPPPPESEGQQPAKKAQSEYRVNLQPFNDLRRPGTKRLAAEWTFGLFCHYNLLCQEHNTSFWKTALHLHTLKDIAARLCEDRNFILEWLQTKRYLLVQRESIVAFLKHKKTTFMSASRHVIFFVEKSSESSFRNRCQNRPYKVSYLASFWKLLENVVKTCFVICCKGLQKALDHFKEMGNISWRTHHYGPSWNNVVKNRFRHR